MDTISGHGAGLRDAQFSPDDQLIVTASEDKTARIWSTKGVSLQELPGHQKLVNSAHFSPDGTRVATASDDGTSRIWAVLTGRRLSIARLPMDDIAFSTGGRWAAGLHDAGDGSRTFGRWPTESPETPDQVVSNMSHFAFSGDGTTSVLVGSEVVWIWDSIKRSSNAIPIRNRKAAVLALNHDGSLMLWSAASEGAQLWQLKPAVRELGVRTPEGADPLPSMDTVAFSPDGRFLLAAMSDGTAGVLNAKNGYLIATLRGPGSALLRATFVRGTDAVVTVNTNGDVRSFNTEECGPKISMLELANRRVTRRLTQAEKVRYLP